MSVRPSKLIGSIWALAFGITLIASSSFARAATAPPSNSPKDVLTVILHDSYGAPLVGVLCEVLSYDWGNQPGQPYAVIAKGETDKNGVVAFNVSEWPRSGYRFKFTKTAHTLPADTFFENEELNQYRGYPGATVGERSEAQRFVIASDGLAYNDLSQEGQLPEYDKNPVAGLENPRLTIIPSEDYLATVRAGTASAEASGIPSPTRPPHPPDTPAAPQKALSVTPEPSPSASTTPIRSSATEVSGYRNTPRAQETATVIGSSASSPPNNGAVQATGGETNLFSSLLLAVAGVACFGLFWKFRRHIYPWLGIEVNAPNSKKVETRRVKLRRSAKRERAILTVSQKGKEEANAKEAQKDE